MIITCVYMPCLTRASLSQGLKVLALAARGAQMMAWSGTAPSRPMSFMCGVEGGMVISSLKHTYLMTLCYIAARPASFTGDVNTRIPKGIIQLPPAQRLCIKYFQI